MSRRKSKASPPHTPQSAKDHVPPTVQPPVSFVRLGREGFKPITLEQLGLTEDEMHILVNGARFLFPPDEDSNT